MRAFDDFTVSTIVGGKRGGGNDELSAVSKFYSEVGERYI